MDDEVRKALRAVQMADQEMDLFLALFWRVKDKILDIKVHRDGALRALFLSAICGPDDEDIEIMEWQRRAEDEYRDILLMLSEANTTGRLDKIRQIQIARVKSRD